MKALVALALVVAAAVGMWRKSHDAACLCIIAAVAVMALG